MKRVAQVSLNDDGGAFALMYQVQKELNGRVIFDYYTIVPFSNNEIKASINEMNGKIYEMNSPSRLLGHFKLPLWFYKSMKKEKYEVIHIHSDSAWKIILYAIPAKLAGIKKVIVHSHSSDVNGDHRKLKLIFHKIMKPILPFFSDVLCSCSEKATKWMYPVKYYPLVNFIKNGVNTSKFQFALSDRKKYRSILKLKDNEILIGTVGNLSYQKNPYYLIEVFSALYNLNYNYKLIFIGGNNVLVSKFKEWSQHKPGGKNIIFYGNTMDVGGLLSALDIYIMPSQFEGFPISAIEAQTNGLPCIFSNRITTEVGFMQTCSFWDINENPELWASRIINLKLDLTTESRQNGYLLANKFNFDIRQTAEKILQLYI